jgi:hypothetical protein
VTSLLFCGGSIDRKWNSAMFERTKIANNFETAAFTKKTCTEMQHKVAAAESIGDDTFVQLCPDGPEMDFRNSLRNENRE